MNGSAEQQAAQASYTSGAVVTLFGGFTWQEIGVLVGIFFCILTYATNTYFQRKRNQRDEEYHNKRMNHVERD